jgi:hypothetical protein
MMRGPPGQWTDDPYTRAEVTAMDVVLACEVLLVAGFIAEALSVLAATVKGRRGLREALKAREPQGPTL